MSVQLSIYWFLLTNSVCPNSLSMLLIKPSQPICMYFLQFTPLLIATFTLSISTVPPFPPRWPLNILLSLPSPFIPLSPLSAQFSCHSAPQFASCLTLHFPSRSSQLFVTHTLSQPHSQTSQLYCGLGSLSSADGKVQWRQQIDWKVCVPCVQCSVFSVAVHIHDKGYPVVPVCLTFLYAVSVLFAALMALLKASLWFTVECSGLDFLYSE